MPTYIWHGFFNRDNEKVGFIYCVCGGTLLSGSVCLRQVAKIFVSRLQRFIAFAPDEHLSSKQPNGWRLPMFGKTSDVKNHLRRKPHKNIFPFKPTSEPDATGDSTGKSPLENEPGTQDALNPEGSLAVIATRKRPA